MKGTSIHIARLMVITVVLACGTAYASQSSTNYSIPLDVIDAGGADVSKSGNYLLSDSIGESVVGYGASSDYILDSGYRQPSAAEFLSLSCTASANIGSVSITGQKTGSGSCTVYTSAYGGYNLSWSVLTGSGGTNTGHLISENNDTIPPFDFSSTDLIAYWKLDEASAGETVVDETGNGNNGTAYGSGGANNLPQPSTNIPANMNVADVRSLDFDGTDDYVDVGNLTSLNGGSYATLSFWAKKDVSTDDVYVMRGDDTKRFGVFWLDSTLYVTNENGVLSYPSVVSSLAGDWTLITLVFDGTQSGLNRLKLYLNASEQTLVAGGADPSSTLADVSASLPMTIGRGRAGTVSYFSSVPIDDVRVYDSALSLAEVEALYRMPHTWSVAADSTAWGARLSSRSTDTDAKWGTDGGAENWLNIGDGNYGVVRRTSATTQSGSTQIFQFRAEVGSSVFQPAGVYQATTTFTVVDY